ncbi:MAG: hypothetical protein RL404_791 [Pseudomonadota bacterium]|jgi:hypothetical protein
MSEPAIRTRDNTTFTLNIDDRIYQCPVSDAALYMLCRDQDNSMNQIDAYLQLKEKVQTTFEKLLVDGDDRMPEVLEPTHFLS